MKMIPVAEPDISSAEKEYVCEALNSSWISSKGKYIGLFEEEFSRYTGAKHSITTMNGTVSLHLILSALGIGPGDEVIVPTFTYIASVNAIKYVGAEPIFIDSDPETWNLNPILIESLITPRTKAIMGVHLYGHSLDLAPILDICERHGIHLIEDSAEALGTFYRSKHVGTFGIAGSFSFFGNKTVTTGEGGMVVTNDDDLAERIAILKDQGHSKTKRYWHEIIGFNYRMTNIQAAIGYGQMVRAHELVEKKRTNARTYSSMLPDGLVTKPVEKEYCRHSYWMYSVLLKKNPLNLMEELQTRFGIETRPFFRPVHLMPPYLKDRENNFPVARYLSESGISLPSSTLLDKDDIGYICESLIQLLEEEK